MSERLKGNYKVPQNSNASKPKEDKPETSTTQFERRALEKLGGSIAFVQKKDTFIWNGEPSDKNKKK